ncbi:MAG: carboxypeptidase regulatory-like domain-containing protein [Bryobacteraceae bacterium]|nr:carboxypeptidase regulatory-like domain-containing protein [Bryobacteraceae bacterium]
MFTRLLCLLVCSVGLWAQVSTGTITGTTLDPAGAVVAGARLSLQHLASGQVRELTSGDRGDFNAAFLRVGDYKLTATAPGFKTKIISPISVRVDQTVNLSIDLDLGVTSESVTVDASTPLLDAATSSVGQVIENKKIVELPLNGRNAFALGLLAGNTVPVSGIGTNLPFVAGGGRFSTNDVMLDGIDNNTSVNNNSIGRNGINYTPSVDAVQEFKVKTNNYSAEFGRSAGAIISATVKSGGNDFHGSAWNFLRNEKLDANNFFSNAGSIKRQPFKQNQYGFTIGGPVIIPKLYNGKNKTFFFADYEGLRRRTTANSNILDIPPDEYRTGNFSRYRAPIYDSRARRIGPTGQVISTPLPNNTIPPSQIFAGSTAVLGLLPKPNFGLPGADTRNFVRIASNPFQNDQFDVKIDQRIGSKNSLFGRISRSLSEDPNPGNFDGFLGGGGVNVRRALHSVLNDTHIFSPSVVNEFRAGYTRQNGSFAGFGPQGADFARQNNIALFPFPVQSFPSIAFNFSGQINTQNQFTGLGGGDPNFNIENTYQLTDNLSIMKGSHAIKFGIDARRYLYDVIRGGGQYIFGSIFSSSSDAPGSGAPLADFLTGFPSATQGTQLLDWSRQRDTYVGSYVQDDWKVSSKLTLNIGLRYEIYTQPIDARNRGGLFDARTGRMALPGKDGFSRAIVKGDHNNWAPRFGFAYSVNRKLTVRSGAGVFFSRREMNQEVTQFGGNVPNTPNLVFPVISATGTVNPPVTVSTPLVALPSDPTFASFTPARPLSVLIRTADFANSANPYAYQWNFSVQYEFMRDTVFEAAYSGLRGNRLVSRVNLNQIPFDVALRGLNQQVNRNYPNVNNAVGLDSATGRSTYDSLLLRFEKRMGNGLNFLTNYTWSKNIEVNGTGGSSSFSQNGGTTFPVDSWNLKNEKAVGSLDVPHVFVASFGYELPFGPGKAWLSKKGPVSYFLGGWQINGIFYRRSGFTTDIRTSRIPAANQLFATINVPDTVQGQSLYAPNRGVDQWFNPAAFSLPGTVTSATGVPLTKFGTAQRRIGRGPRASNMDFSLFKNFPIGERLRVQFRAEAFNLSNTPAFFLPGATSQALTIGNASFGKLTSSSATGRQLQMGLKVIF